MNNSKWPPAMIQQLRAKLRLSKSEMSRRLGLWRGTVHSWESGRDRPNATSRWALNALEAGVPLTPEEFKEKMEHLFPKARHEKESAHAFADALMCRVLRQLGYGDGVEVFDCAPGITYS